ncbi:MAG: hypothetical protein JWM68_1236 [Verrucomicrobiales bacterium]|nr:hypothetical protein [Verrucomicrobiales bacterium]
MLAQPGLSHDGLSALGQVHFFFRMDFICALNEEPVTKFSMSRLSSFGKDEFHLVPNCFCAVNVLRRLNVPLAERVRDEVELVLTMFNSPQNSTALYATLPFPPLTIVSRFVRLYNVGAEKAATSTQMLFSPLFW